MTADSVGIEMGMFSTVGVFDIPLATSVETVNRGFVTSLKEKEKSQHELKEDVKIFLFSLCRRIESCRWRF